MARSQLLSFPYPLEAGLCPYIAEPALPDIPSRGPFLLPLFSRACGRGFSSIICPSYQLRYALNISSSISTVFLGSANHPTDHTTLPSERITLSAILSPSFTGGSPLPGEQSLPT
jgi:hypothetical protein